jgi:predicted NAD/FAD-binding protein
MIHYLLAAVNKSNKTTMTGTVGGKTMKIAVIGSGISGLACAYELHKAHEVHVLESEPRIGGHTATVDVTIGGRHFAIDTGFIVFNDWTYPEFIVLMEKLGVASKPTEMSFSVSDTASGLEYAGTSINTLFAQRRNLLSPRYFGLLRDVMRFNRQSIIDLDEGRVEEGMTLGDYLLLNKYGAAFVEYYLIPMGSAIWSADTAQMMNFPLQFFVRFLRNHGLLNVVNRPQWRVIEGGSREYIKPLTAGFANNIRTNTAVRGVRRLPSGVELTLDHGRECYDQVVFACHSDQALDMLVDPSPAEREILSAIPYQENEVVLHTDKRLLPKNPRAWASWNYRRSRPDQAAALTYNMNILQGLDAPETFCVTLNQSESINPHKVLGRFSYSHPVFTVEGTRAQQRWSEINHANTWYCGAYWRNGFHEDGVASAMRVAQAILDSVEVQASPAQALGSAA